MVPALRVPLGFTVSAHAISDRAHMIVRGCRCMDLSMGE